MLDLNETGHRMHGMAGRRLRLTLGIDRPVHEHVDIHATPIRQFRDEQRAVAADVGSGRRQGSGEGDERPAPPRRRASAGQQPLIDLGGAVGHFAPRGRGAG